MTSEQTRGRKTRQAIYRQLAEGVEELRTRASRAGRRRPPTVDDCGHEP